MKVDNTSKQFIQYIAAEIRDMPDGTKPKFAVAMLRQGLTTTPWLLRLMRKLYGEENFYERLEAVYTYKRELLDHYYKNFFGHLLNGKDTYDKTSAGGYSQKELELIVSTMTRFGWVDDTEGQVA